MDPVPIELGNPRAHIHCQSELDVVRVAGDSDRRQYRKERLWYVKQLMGSFLSKSDRADGIEGTYRGGRQE